MWSKINQYIFPLSFYISFISTTYYIRALYLHLPTEILLSFKNHRDSGCVSINLIDLFMTVSPERE